MFHAIKDRLERAAGILGVHKDVMEVLRYPRRRSRRRWRSAWTTAASRRSRPFAAATAR
jgi:hypothetical protein